MDSAAKVIENRLRRMAERQGYRREKSHRRDPRAIGFGRYMLVDPATNAVIIGGSPVAYSATLDEIAEFLHRGPKA